MAGSLALVTLVLATGLGACTAAPPAMPSYATDVQPIFMAHCTRCHGIDGPDGGFLGDPAMFPLGGNPEGYMPGLPFYCHFDAYGDRGTDCVLDATGSVPSGCVMGANTCVMYFKARLLGYIQGQVLVMPPPPASLLSDWERDIVVRWAKNPLP